MNQVSAVTDQSMKENYHLNYWYAGMGIGGSILFTGIAIALSLRKIEQEISGPLAKCSEAFLEDLRGRLRTVLWSYKDSLIENLSTTELLKRLRYVNRVNYDNVINLLTMQTKYLPEGGFYSENLLNVIDISGSQFSKKFIKFKVGGESFDILDDVTWFASFGMRNPANTTLVEDFKTLVKERATLQDVGMSAEQLEEFSQSAVGMLFSDTKSALLSFYREIWTLYTRTHQMDSLTRVDTGGTGVRDVYTLKQEYIHSLKSYTTQATTDAEKELLAEKFEQSSILEAPTGVAHVRNTTVAVEAQDAQIARSLTEVLGEDSAHIILITSSSAAKGFLIAKNETENLGYFENAWRKAALDPEIISNILRGTRGLVMTIGAVTVLFFIGMFLYDIFKSNGPDDHRTMSERWHDAFA